MECGCHLVNGPGEYEISGVLILGIGTYHDAVKGQSRGKNTVYLLEIDGLTICHLGDIGHIIRDETVEEMEKVDILMLPVGGVNGTLKNRMQTFHDEKRIRAKSGRIRGVNATSGYIFPYNSRDPLAFSILINNFRGSHNYVISVQDRFLESILDFTNKNAKTVHN